MKIIIVGAGIAGLTAGVYAQQSGIETVILESHSIAGGNSTAWKRKGYFFEGGMHWLVGSSDKTSLNRIWREIGALQQNNPLHLRDPFMTYISKGESINLYRDTAKLEKHLLAIAPQDKKAIHGLCKDIRAMSKVMMPITDIKGVKAKKPAKMQGSEILGMLSAMPTMGRLSNITAGDYADRFTHPGIRALLHSIVGLDTFNAMSVAVTLGGQSAGDGGYPKGGALQMAQNIVNTFNALGGEIRYNTRAARVLQEKQGAKGVVLESGETLYADAVIVTADTLTINNGLFNPPLNEPWLKQMEREVKTVNCTFICLGVKADLKHIPDGAMFSLEKPFEYGGNLYESLAFNNYANYEGYAPSGCTALTCYLGKSDTYDLWRDAKQNGTYEQKKAELAQTIIECLEASVPQTKGRVEVVDVATPLTYERYCSTYRGSWMSVLSTENKRTSYPCKAQSVNGLYFAGQRIVIPGGLPTAAYTARLAVQHICNDNNIVFQNNI